MIEESLMQKYILTRKLLEENFCKNKIDLQYDNLQKNEILESEIVDEFCETLKNKEKCKGKLNISYNNLSENNLFKIISCVYENECITGINMKYNKITPMILHKILLIIEHNHLLYLNIQNTQLTNEAIKNIIFHSLYKNIQVLKLPALNHHTIKALTQYLKNNNSVVKLHFIITNKRQDSDETQENENDTNSYQSHLHHLKKLFKDLLLVIEEKNNITKIKCSTDFADEELEDMIDSIESICQEHEQILEKKKKFSENKINIDSFDILNLLKPDLLGKIEQSTKFEKEDEHTFDQDAIHIIEKIIL